jgi:hypothetical protein
MPTPSLLPYKVTKAGVATFMAGLAQLLSDRGIRANSVARHPSSDEASYVWGARIAVTGGKPIV